MEGTQHIELEVEGLTLVKELVTTRSVPIPGVGPEGGAMQAVVIVIQEHQTEALLPWAFHPKEAVAAAISLMGEAMIGNPELLDVEERTGVMQAVGAMMGADVTVQEKGAAPPPHMVAPARPRSMPRHGRGRGR